MISPQKSLGTGHYAKNPLVSGGHNLSILASNKHAKLSTPGFPIDSSMGMANY
jgi:hypothetical protein